MKNRQKQKRHTKKQRKNRIFRKTGGKRRQQQMNTTQKTNFFTGGSYPGPPYERENYFIDPQRQMVDSRLLPNMQSGGRKLRKTQKIQKGGFYGIDVSKALSSIYPYSLSNVNSMVGLPATSRILNNQPITSMQDNRYRGIYLV